MVSYAISRSYRLTVQRCGARKRVLNALRHRFTPPRELLETAEVAASDLPSEEPVE